MSDDPRKMCSNISRDSFLKTYTFCGNYKKYSELLSFAAGTWTCRSCTEDKYCKVCSTLILCDGRESAVYQL